MRKTMRRKLLWFIVGNMVVLAMVLASCAPTTTTTQQPTTTTQPTVTTTTTTTTQQPTTTTVETKTTGPTLLAPEVPKYGGVFTRVWHTDPIRFDSYWSPDMIQNYYQDTLVTGDWAKGPAGTGETDWNRPGFPIVDVYTGGIAESWELPDAKTIIYHIRKGVHFALDPDSEASRLVNGREVVADDFIKSWERWYSNPASYISNVIFRKGIVRMDAPDKYTIVIQFDPNPAPGEEFFARRGWAFQIYMFMRFDAPELAKKYGDLRDWHNAVGTGPYMLKDYIPGSMITFKRNPNYYMFDPIHPENRLPYVEISRQAIIPDKATQLAALRTGKLDHVDEVSWDDGESLVKTNPELKYIKHISGYSGTWVVALRVDKPEQPWYKQEVRHALTMAIDYEGLKNGFYGGEATYPAWPVAPFKEFQDFGFYRPLNDLPADIQELFSYNPTKAKQMLADAGYPNGFKASVITQAKDSAMAEIFKAYWADVGVDLSIDIKEPAVFSGIQTSNTHPELLLAPYTGTYPTNLMNYLPRDWHNHTMYAGPEMSPKALEMDEQWFNAGEMGKIYHDFQEHLFRLALYVGTPSGYEYKFWQPWVQNYHGELQVGNAVRPNWVKYIWVDMDLKKSLGK